MVRLSNLRYETYSRHPMGSSMLFHYNGEQKSLEIISFQVYSHWVSFF